MSSSIPDRRFRTDKAASLFDGIKPALMAMLEAANSREFPDLDERGAALHSQVEAARVAAAEDDGVLADLFVVDRYVDLVAAYCHTWQLIVQGKFAASWLALQDAMDVMRLIKRFSALDVSYFEDQLLALEPAYPYNIFFSVGMRVGHFECSVCGRDIDSRECPHRRGELYRGAMVCGIARDIAQLDHVSMVENPEDKRCVVQYENDAPQFRLVRYISDVVASGRIRVSDYRRLDWSKESRPNPEYVKLGRNQLCFCDSGRKFKHCCIDKRTVHGDHAEVIATPRKLADAVV